VVLPRLTRFEFDRAYVERLATGDTETERHFTKYFGDLLSIKLRSRLRSATLVEDAKQETFLRVLTTLRQRGGVTSAGSLGAFVNSVCNNVLFELYRAESKLRRHEPDTAQDLVEPRPSAESTLVADDEQARVRRAVLALPERDQQLLRWVFFDERDRGDICRELGIERPYLRVLLHRARDRFHDEYVKLGDTADPSESS
jgi:RNA polymerase sigma-70 factor (ECF subfamily)